MIELKVIGTLVCLVGAVINFAQGDFKAGWWALTAAIWASA